MSAGTPIPPVPLPAPQPSPFRYLWSDPWIAISWLLPIGAGIISHPAELPSAAPQGSDALTSFVVTGYVVWSGYFGLAAWWRFGIGGRLWGFASRWIGHGFLAMLIIGSIICTLALIYAV